jgi:alpha/beta superfamily hydrolase
VGQTRWTQKNPPNYVERSLALLGRTVDTGRVWDIIATARYLHAEHADIPLYVAGEGPGAVLAAYAALLEPDIAGVIAINPPSSHMDAKAPQFLNILRVCDIPDVFGMLAPRPLIVLGGKGDALTRVAQIYAAAGASTKLQQKP